MGRQTELFIENQQIQARDLISSSGATFSSTLQRSRPRVTIRLHALSSSAEHRAIAT
jgi:hypothetical protein